MFIVQEPAEKPLEVNFVVMVVCMFCLSPLSTSAVNTFFVHEFYDYYNPVLMVQYLIHVLLADVPITTILVLYAVVFICLFYLFLLINQRSGVLKEQPPLA